MDGDVVENTTATTSIGQAERRLVERNKFSRTPAMVPPVSPLLWHLFGRYARRYIRRSFHAVRLSRAGRPPVVRDRPVAIFLNHPSWWDPLLCLFLAQRFYADRKHYAPIDASALARYRFFTRLGFFGVVPGTRQGARTFVRTSRAIFQQQTATTLWLTPQGRFADPRQRPVRLQSGMRYLARYVRDVVFVPLALEYPFWEERFPEVLVRFGAPIQLGPESSQGTDDDVVLLARRLQETQDGLAREACGRQVDAFDVILRGREGMGGIYETWFMLRARFHGERWHRSHGEK
jgi:1-acyl-sn-glycerol-3-phosphate acyltransferase